MCVESKALFNNREGEMNRIELDGVWFNVYWNGVKIAGFRDWWEANRYLIHITESNKHNDDIIIQEIRRG